MIILIYSRYHTTVVALEDDQEMASIFSQYKLSLCVLYLNPLKGGAQFKTGQQYSSKYS